MSDDTDDSARRLTIHEVAACLQLSVSSVRRLKIPSTLAPDAHGVKRQVRGYRVGDVEAWFEAQGVTPLPGSQS